MENQPSEKNTKRTVLIVHPVTHKRVKAFAANQGKTIFDAVKTLLDFYEKHNGKI